MEAGHRTDISQIDLPALVSALREALHSDVQFDTAPSDFRQVPFGVARPRCLGARCLRGLPAVVRSRLASAEIA